VSHSVPAHQTGIGIPAARFMTHPTTVSSTKPVIGTAISPGVCKKPRLTRSVVAPLAGARTEQEQERPRERSRPRAGAGRG